MSVPWQVNSGAQEEKVRLNPSSASYYLGTLKLCHLFNHQFPHGYSVDPSTYLTTVTAHMTIYT